MTARWLLVLPILAAGPAQDSRPASAPASRRAADGTIRGAGRVEARLDATRRSAAYDLVPSKSGTLTIRLDAFDFDARLRVEDADGKTLDEDDRGWIEPLVSCTVEAREGATLRVVADSREDGGRGELAVTVAEGAAPLLEGEAYTREVVAYTEQGAARAGARGDWTRAGILQAARAEALATAARVPEARAGIEAALKEARERSARAAESILLSWIARSEARSGDRAKQRARIDEAARAARDCGEPKTRATMLCLLGGHLLDLQE
ncbi:MAG TPA: hypothetical protein VKE69_02675, partial [Planctomycetota bacterium]|nr:hypothetical protein [Planctomycetota bacterium]